LRHLNNLHSQSSKLNNKSEIKPRFNKINKYVTILFQIRHTSVG
jgi:hypothetical protein